MSPAPSRLSCAANGSVTNTPPGGTTGTTRAAKESCGPKIDGVSSTH